MSKVITFSRVFPSYHPRAGEPTYFVEQIWNGFRDDYFALSDEYIPFVEKYVRLKAVGEPLHFGGVKYHTIRAGHRWKAGDWFSPRVWSGKPYHSKMIQFAPDIQVKKTWDVEVITEADDRESDWSFMNFLGQSYTYYSQEYAKETVKKMACNDGFNNTDDLWEWIRPRNRNSKPFDGQIICWNESIEY